MLKNKKRVFTILAIIALIIIVIVCNNISKKRKQEQLYKQEQQRVLQYSKIEDFKNIEEVITYLDSILISKEESDIENVDYVLKMKIKYELESNVKNYYEKLIQYSAYVLEYKNFYIIDEEKNINILVVCNSEKKSVSTYYINNIESYFEKIESKENINNFTENKTINVNVNSQQIQQLQAQDWNINNIELGTIESIYRKYNIYFDEGYEIRTVGGKVFNIVFTQKYDKDIIENIKVTTDNKNIINKLGNPHYESNDIIGYKTKDFYIFFSNEQVSIYPVIQYRTEKIVEIIEKYKDKNELVKYMDEIKEVWNDYDIYEYDNNYVVLQYTLKGICFKYDLTAQKGIVFYNNYNGNLTSQINIKDIVEQKNELPDNMYFENLNLVFEEEKARLSSLDNHTKHQNNTTAKILNISKKFKVNIDTTKQVRFVSINKEFQNSELKEFIDYGIWYDDYNFIYSVKGRGIFKYNAKTCEYSTIIQGQDTYKLMGIDKNILYFDETNINIE